MSGEHELPTASVVRSSQATLARRRGQLCTDVRPAGLHLSKPVPCSDNRSHLSSSGLGLLLAALALVATAPASAASLWNEEPIQSVFTTNRTTGQPETLSHSFVSWFGAQLAPPQLNKVYYARMR